MLVLSIDVCFQQSLICFVFSNYWFACSQQLLICLFSALMYVFSNYSFACSRHRCLFSAIFNFLVFVVILAIFNSFEMLDVLKTFHSFSSISVITHKQQFPLMPLISCSVWIALETFNWPSQVTDLSAMIIPVIVIVNSHLERNNLYYFSCANQQKAGTKIYSLTQCSLTVNECDWHILAGNDERINSRSLTRFKYSNK